MIFHLGCSEILVGVMFLPVATITYATNFAAPSTSEGWLFILDLLTAEMRVKNSLNLHLVNVYINNWIKYSTMNIEIWQYFYNITRNTEKRQFQTWTSLCFTFDHLYVSSQKRHQMPATLSLSANNESTHCSHLECKKLHPISFPG